MSRKSRYRGPLDKQHGKWDQTVLKSEWHKFYQIYWSLLAQLNPKKFLLVISKILGLFFHTLSAGHKFSLLNRDKVRQPIRMQLSRKKQTFFVIFFAILKYR